ncbi:MAG: ABC transporter substrate-binding protein [Tissierellia bacterium]|nr:ABC transporter substrate-binding protein [Tissierellia bacterium]
MKRFKYITIIFILILFTACGRKEKDIEYTELEREKLSEISATPGGEITIPIVNTDTFNPLYASNSTYYYFSKLIFEGLFNYDEKGVPTQQIVEYYVLSPDKTSLSITLRDDVFWHDGKKLTTKDVETTFNAIKKLESDSIYYEHIKNCVGAHEDFDISTFANVEVFDSRNIDFHFEKPYRDYLDMMIFPILPSHIYNAEEMLEKENFKMIGTGPFSITESDSEGKLMLVRNDMYYSALPNILNIGGKLVNSNELALVAFESGQIDLTTARNYDWNKYENNTRIRYEEFSTNKLELIAINTQRQKFSGERGQLLRKAVALAINKRRIIDRVYLGKGIEATSLINPNHRYGTQAISEFYYNEDESKALLKKAGFRDMNNDGLLEDELGNTIDIGVKTNALNSSRKLAAEFIIQDLRAVGINAYADYKDLPAANISEEMQNEDYNNFINDITQRNYDIAFYGINMGMVTDLSSLLHSSAIGNMNVSAYSNYEMDNLLQRVKIDEEDISTEELYNMINKIINIDMPYIPIMFRQEAILIDSRIQGELNPNEFDNFRGFKNIFILKQFQ